MSETGAEPVAHKGRRLLAFLPLIIVLAIFLLFAVRLKFGGDASFVPSPLIGKTVPPFALQAVEGLGKPGLATADLKTGQVTVLNVFASWCVPCRQEQHMLVDLAGKGARIVGIAYKDQPENTRRFLNQEADPFKAVGADISGRTGIDLGVYGVPETYVVKGDGTIVDKIVGPLTEANIKSNLLPSIDAAGGCVSGTDSLGYMPSWIRGLFPASKPRSCGPTLRH